MKTQTERRKYVEDRHRENRQIRELERTLEKIWQGYGEQYLRNSEENMEYASSKEKTKLYNNEESGNDSERQADQLDEEEIVVVVISKESIKPLKNSKIEEHHYRND
ncbi:hypothetical protein HHI36_019049 [Cryptolaemus montrouzieri]|uniref:Uncharacterized protein n=1 Tax=Cryptolaemus montrouzieri TaxID=559131 RepID=A0ABD2P1U1_9CUCU